MPIAIEPIPSFGGNYKLNSGGIPFDRDVKTWFDGFLMKPKPPNPSDVMTTPQVCRTLSITRQTLYNWLGNGKLKPWLKVGGASWLFTKTDVASLQGTKHKKVVVRSRRKGAQSK